jgi:hypothetical protein
VLYFFWGNQALKFDDLIQKYLFFLFFFSFFVFFFTFVGFIIRLDVF